MKAKLIVEIDIPFCKTEDGMKKIINKIHLSVDNQIKIMTLASAMLKPEDRDLKASTKIDVNIISYCVDA